MSPTRALRSVGTGCTFTWVSKEAADEARVLLERDLYARAQLAALVERLERDTLRKGKDYRQIQSVDDDPPLYELKLDTTRPALRLYFIEESHGDEVKSSGLLLAPKPPGTPDEQRVAQNEDIVKANARRPKL